MAKHNCSKTVYSNDRWPRPHLCTRSGIVERDGKWYCKIHDPISVVEKEAARRAKWEAESAVNRKKWALESAAADLLVLAKEARSGLVAFASEACAETISRLDAIIAKAEGTDT